MAATPPYCTMTPSIDLASSLPEAFELLSANNGDSKAYSVMSADCVFFEHAAMSNLCHFEQREGDRSADSPPAPVCWSYEHDAKEFEQSSSNEVGVVCVVCICMPGELCFGPTLNSRVQASTECVLAFDDGVSCKCACVDPTINQHLQTNSSTQERLESCISLFKLVRT